MLKPGDLVPDISVDLTDGSRLNLRSPGESLVVYFFPKAFSPVCTREACSFRDAKPRFEAGRIVGISQDSLVELVRFRDKHKLGYELASDTDGAIQRAFGAMLFGKIPRRATFTVSKDGKVIRAHANDFSANSHVNHSIG